MTDKSPPAGKRGESHNEGKNVKHRDNQKSSKLLILSILLNSVLIAILGYFVQQTYQNEKIYTDCTDYFRAGYRQDGVYEVRASRVSDKHFNVYCNMTAGGWTVLFKRSLNSKTEFQLPMESYKIGFGDLNDDHWVGLDNMNLLTRDKERELMIIVNSTSFRYKNFKVLNEYYHYKFVVEDEIDKFIDGSSMLRLNNSLFSTPDVDFDLAVNSSCSAGWKAGWWFTDCFDHSLCMTCMIMHGNTGVKKLTYAVMLIK